MYGIDARGHGHAARAVVPRTEDFAARRGDAAARGVAAGDIDLVFVANPNNPTGQPDARDVPHRHPRAATDALVLVDEAYFEFSRHTMRPHMERHPNLVILRTFSKAFSLAGLRVGYLLAHEDVVTRADEGAPAVLGRPLQPVGRRDGLPRARGVRRRIREIIRQRGVVFDGAAGAARRRRRSRPRRTSCCSRAGAAHAVWRDLLRPLLGARARLLGQPGLEDCLRVTIGTEAENRRVPRTRCERYCRDRRAPARRSQARCHA